jgi:hypothetical protein
VVVYAKLKAKAAFNYRVWDGYWVQGTEQDHRHYDKAKHEHQEQAPDTSFEIPIYLLTEGASSIVLVHAFG